MLYTACDQIEGISTCQTTTPTGLANAVATLAQLGRWLAA
jgi:hypothetical protein